MHHRPGESALTGATLSCSQADPVLFLLTKPVQEPGYASLDAASTTTPTKARTQLKRLCGQYTDDQFGRELFPGTDGWLSFILKNGSYTLSVKPARLLLSE